MYFSVKYRNIAFLSNIMFKVHFHEIYNFKSLNGLQVAHFWYLKHHQKGAKIWFSRFPDSKYSLLNLKKFIWSFLDDLIVICSSTIVKKYVIRFNCNRLIWSSLDGLNVKFSTIAIMKKGIMRFNWNKLIWSFLDGLIVKISSTMMKKRIMRFS